MNLHTVPALRELIFKKKVNTLKKDSRTRQDVQLAGKWHKQQALFYHSWNSRSKTHLDFTGDLIHPSQSKANMLRTVNSIRILPGGAPPPWICDVLNAEARSQCQPGPVSG